MAITRLGILQIPMLQGSTPMAVLAFAFFEYIVYWGIALILADGLRRVWSRHKPDQAGQ